LRNLFLDDLPTYENNKINWSKSIGYDINFNFDDITGFIKIINYRKIKKSNILTIEYNKKHFNIHVSSFLKCSLSNILGIITKDYKFKIRDIINDDKRNIEILDTIRIKHNNSSEKGYNYKCLICGNIDTIRESNLIIGQGCNVCCIPSKKILIGYNDISTTHPELIKYLANIEDAYKHTYSSAKDVDIKCPDCGYIKNMKIYQLYINGFSCPKCGDKIPYPNKFIREFINQLNEEYIPEYSPDWAIIKNNSNIKLNGKKKYDNLLINHNEIWEVHGLQHYGEGFSRYGKTARTLEEEQENDKLKKELAEQNGLKYIVIDVRYSELEHIKNSIMNIPEFKRYDLSLIDWNRCHEVGCSNLVKVICDLWNNGIKSTLEISKIKKLGRSTVTKYLNQGAKLGWCDYNGAEMVLNGIVFGKKTNKPIIQLSLKGEYIKEYESALEAERQLNIGIISKHISGCCKGKRKTTGGFRWVYKDEYYNNINNISQIEVKIKNKPRFIMQLSLDNEFIKEWNSVTEAKVNTNIINISECCSGKRRSAGGFKWMYKEDYEEMLLNNTQYPT